MCVCPTLPLTPHKSNLDPKKPKPITDGVAWAPIYLEMEFRLMCYLFQN